MSNEDQYIFCLIGYRFIKQHIGKINSNISKIQLHSDIEYLHQTRVASRKIRSALRVFDSCSKKIELMNFSADIKKITRSLGKARDLDVQMVFLKNILGKTKKKKVVFGIDTILQHKKILRQRAQLELEEVLAYYSGKSYHSNYTDLFNNNFESTRLYNVKARNAILNSKFITSIQQLIIEILSLNEIIKDKKNISDLHNLRILIKKLRYALELIYPYFQNELEDKLSILKKLQEKLGEIHDMDVWIVYLPKFIKKELPTTRNELNINKSNKNIKIGISHLEVYCKKRREKQFKNFYNNWKRLIDKKFWNELIKLESPL